MGLSDYDIASTLATTVSQRLVRRICPDCRREREFTSEEKEIANLRDKHIVLVTYQKEKATEGFKQKRNYYKNS